VARRAIGQWINTTVLGKFMVMAQPWSADAYAEHAGYTVWSGFATPTDFVLKRHLFLVWFSG
jgi:hypothetical protein